MNSANTIDESAIRVALPELLAICALACGAALAESKRATAAQSGLHLSRWRGRGVDFRESRIYQPGDDIRHMDWRVTARSGRAHTKLFEEERERGLLLLVDFNPGMRFGTRVRFKSVQAARAASLLAWLASANGDRVGICGFGGGITAEVKPARGRRGVLQVLRALRDWDHAAGEDSEALSSGLERARRLLRPGMRLILVSDGFSVDAQSSPALLRSAGRHELGAVLLSDQLEQHPPPGGRFALSLAGKRHVLDFGNLRMRTQWSQSFAERRLRLRSELQRIGARVVDLSTDSDLRRSLAPFTQRSVGPRDSQA